MKRAINIYDSSMQNRIIDEIMNLKNIISIDLDSSVRSAKHKAYEAALRLTRSLERGKLFDEIERALKEMDEKKLKNSKLHVIFAILKPKTHYVYLCYGLTIDGNDVYGGKIDVNKIEDKILLVRDDGSVIRIGDWS